MLEKLYKNSVTLKDARRSVRRFFRSHYEAIDEDHLQVSLKLAHAALKRINFNFNAEKHLFSAIQIQTRIGCNYSCSFCPANKPDENLYGGASNGEEMQFNLYKKIIDELSALDFHGRISPYLMNEPLLDKRMADFVSYAREKCPYSFLFLQTNGSLIDADCLSRLIDAGLDELYVNDYTDNQGVINHIKEMHLSKDTLAHLTVEKRNKNEHMSNRAGSFKTDHVLKHFLPISCAKPFNQMFIAFNGEAVLCCQDWRFTQVMGDLQEHSLKEIWANKAYNDIRHSLNLFHRDENALCAKCDFGGLW